jgi:fucose permease
MPSLPAPRLRAARLAVSVLFFANGMASASILPRLPAIKEGLGLSNAELGAAVAALPLGGLIAGGLAGILMARFGSGRVAAVAGTLDVLAIIALGLAPSWAALAAAYFVMGMFDATMDASMNTHGVGVERAYGRSILQGFHGAWSAGCLVAGVVGALAAGFGVPVSIHLASVGLVMAAAILLTARNLLPASVADVRPRAEGEIEVRIHPRNAPHLLRVLVPVAMLGILTVGVQTAAATWSSVFGTDVLGLTAGLAAVGYVLYAAGMTIFRMLNDRWVDGLGPTRFVRIGAVVSFIAMLAVIASAPLHAPLLAFAGFAGIGVGTSPMFPMMAAVSGSLPGIPAGYGVALTSWLVRVGLMVAPALIGAAADAVGLAAALWIPAAAAAAIFVFAASMTRADVQRAVRVEVAA